MQKAYRKKGSITVFLTLLLLLVASFIFALLEAARIKGVDTKAEVVNDVAVESLFAEYQRELYDEYGLLFLDGAYGSGSFQIENVERRLEEMNCKNLYDAGGQMREFYQLEIAGCRIPAYQLATDGDGSVFRYLAADAAKRGAAAAAVKDFKEETAQKKEMEQNGSVEDYLEKAEKAKDEAVRQKDEQSDSMTNNTAQNTCQNVKNPIEEVRKYKSGGTLSIVVRDEGALSQKAISIESTLERRSLEKGNMQGNSRILDEIWFLKYLEEHYGNYGKVQADHVLDYEMEYILEGKASDIENIEEVIKNLIKIREISNLAYLAKDVKRQAEAGELALALMGWTLLEPAITATKWGILAAWAYVESILDVRALLEGRRIPWIKTGEQWNSGLGGLGNDIDGFAMSKDCENGWDYTRYLQFLMCFKEKQSINYRSMDLIEANISNKANRSIKMDHMIAVCKSKTDYEAEPLFWRYVRLGNSGLDVFTIKKEKRYSY